jgi:cobalt-zinc-cadmium efflux system outer membrane protein
MFSGCHRARLRRCAAVCLAVLTAIAYPLARAQAGGLTYDAALEAALARAPMLEARRASAQGAAAARTSAGRLPDPRLALGLENVPVEGDDRYSLTDDFMTMRQIGWMQEVPNRSKRAAQREVAAALADREQALVAVERQAVRRQVALAWLERYYAEQRLALFGELERENRVLQDTVNARIAAGRAIPAEATVARQEAVELAARRDELQRERAKAQAALKRWAGDAAEAPLAGAPKLPALGPEQLRENIAHHVELAAFDPMLRMAAAETRQAQAGKRPDWAWEVAYSKRGSEFDDMVSVQVSVQLPLFAGTRRDPQIYAKAQEEARIRAEREETLRQHVHMIEALIAEEEAVASQLARVREQSLSLADERVRLTMASYAAGRADLGAVLIARRERVQTRLRAIELEGQRDALRAQLAYLFAENHP